MSFAFDHNFIDVTKRGFLSDRVPLHAGMQVGRPVHEIEVGKLILPSGELVVSGRVGSNDAFRCQLRPGAYEVILATDFMRNLYASIRISAEPVVSWDTAPPCPKEAKGFSAERGLGCFCSKEVWSYCECDDADERIHEACAKLLSDREMEAYRTLPPGATVEEASVARRRQCQANPSGMLFWDVRVGNGNAIIFQLASDGFHSCHIGMSRDMSPAVLVVPVAMEWDPR